MLLGRMMELLSPGNSGYHVPWQNEDNWHLARMMEMALPTCQAEMVSKSRVMGMELQDTTTHITFPKDLWRRRSHVGLRKSHFEVL